jgi:hypothetical protein
MLNIITSIYIPLVSNVASPCRLWFQKWAHGVEMVVIPHHLESVIICSGTIIDVLAFSYWDRNGHRHTTQFWGGILGDVQTVSKLNK